MKKLISVIGSVLLMLMMLTLTACNGAVDGFGVVIIIISVVMWFISGVLSSRLSDMKGYSGGFLIGFLLGIIGLIYTAGLPDMKLRKVHVNENKKLSNKQKDLIEEEIEDEEEVKICPNCGWQIFNDEKTCSNCGYKIR